LPAYADPVIGSKVSMDKLKDFFPKYKEGSKWVYTSLTQMGKMKVSEFDMTTQIISVNADTITVQVTGLGMNTKNTVKKSDFSPISAGKTNFNYTYEGTENVAVPAGSFNGASKFDFSADKQTANLNTKVWFVKGMGPVKSEAKGGASGMNIVSTVSLKKFTY
jgi:hypothetical protein